MDITTAKMLIKLGNEGWKDTEGTEAYVLNIIKVKDNRIYGRCSYCAPEYRGNFKGWMAKIDLKTKKVKLVDNDFSEY